MTHSRPSVLLAIGLLCVFAQIGCHQFDFGPRVAAGEIDIYDDLFSVSVVDEEHAVAVGYQGAVYWTENGGDKWNKGTTPTNHLLYSVSMADMNHGWAVGQSGTVLHTTDGGKTWTSQENVKLDEGTHLFGVHAINEATAWAVGDWGTRIHTTDGGATWIDDSITITVDHPMFVWLSPSEKMTVRNGGKVYEDVGLTNVYCLDAPSTNCWIIGEFGYIFHSDDRGAHWNRSQIVGDVWMDPIGFGYNQIGIGDDDVSRLTVFAKMIENESHLNILIDPFVSEREMKEFGNPDDPDALFDIISARIDETKGALEDAGILSDRMRMPNKPPWDYEDFQQDDPTFLQRYFEGRVAEEPRIDVAVIQNPYLFTVHFSDEENGLISGLGGVVLRSEDGGESWRYEGVDRKQALFSVTSVNGRSITVGEKGIVRISTDGGSQWSIPTEAEFPTVFTFMRDVDFEQKLRVGFIVGQQGMVLRSQDGGKSWEKVLPPGDLGVGRIL